MGNAAGKIPEIARSHILHEAAALRVDGGNSRFSIDHVCPFGGNMPVQLADTSGLETHVHAGHFGGDRQLTHCYFTRPAARGYSVPGGGVGEFEVGNGAGVGFR